ncbi:hypothetical protein G6F44_013152 [Rhizopus delemar]|nr:hypothetical protein G6F44_013152 [Rhizopus delemar]
MGIANTDAGALSRRDQSNNQHVSESNGKTGSNGSSDSEGSGSSEREDEDNEIPIRNFKRYQKDDNHIQIILRNGVKQPFLWVNEILYYEYEDKKKVPVLPARMVKTLLRHVHDAPTSGHFGLDKTLDKAKQMAWWCPMKDDVKVWLQHCEKCQRYKIRNTSAVAPLKPIIPTRLGEIWATDIAILPLSSKGNRYTYCIFTKSQSN